MDLLDRFPSYDHVDSGHWAFPISVTLNANPFDALKRDGFIAGLVAWEAMAFLKERRDPFPLWVILMHCQSSRLPHPQCRLGK